MTEPFRRALIDAIRRDTNVVESINEPLLRKAHDSATREKQAYEAEVAELQRQCDPQAFMDKLAELSPPDLAQSIAQWKEKKAANEVAIPNYMRAARVASERLNASEKCRLDLLHTQERLRVNTLNVESFDKKKAELGALLEELRTSARSISSELPAMDTEIQNLVRTLRKEHAKD